jgi:ABC-type branched-subunit amino acid transport system substrate-binding protein
MPNSLFSSAGQAAPRFSGMLVGALLLGLLAGCQNATQDAVTIEPPHARQARREAARALKPQETIGGGPVRIGMITGLMSASGASQRERDVRDGATLAVEELGGGQLSLNIENTDGSPQQVREAARRLADQGTRLVALSAAEVPAGVVRDGMNAKGVPILLLGTSSSERADGSFSFTSDRIDSAVEGASYAAASGSKRLVVLLPADVTASERQRLDRGLAGYNVKPVLVATAGAVSFSGDANSMPRFKDIDAILLVSAGEAEIGSLSALRANGYLTPNVIVLGSSQWTPAAFARPELARSQLCLFGPENGSRMTASFRQRYERAANLDATYGFDVIALAAGLVRTQGESGINKQNLLTPNGFLGAAAAFRFVEDGSVRRTCAIYQIVDGKLSLADPAPRSF